MESKKLLELINLIREKAENNKLIIFVGAGVSQNVDGMPSWYSLVNAMANAIGYSKCDSCRHKDDYCEKECKLKDEYSNDEFLKIPQYVYNQSPELYNKILAEQIKEVFVDAPLSKLIFKINPAHIITTNYDTLLEMSTSDLREQYQVIVTDRDLLDTTKNKYIIKMHGDLHDISTIVLKEQDYLNYSQERVLIELFIKSLLTDHTVLFLGYSLNDYNIKQIISWLNHMRSQNDALKGVKVGYIVFDEDCINERQKTYFENNSIGIINIHNMPNVENIPDPLTNEKGKKLYSFLNVIENPSLESNFEPQIFISKFLELVRQYSYISYKSLLKLLHIGRYEKKVGELLLFEKKDYEKLKSYFESNTSDAIELKQRFIDSGIGIITDYSSFNPTLSYEFYENIESTLFQNKAFELYVHNDYQELEKFISNDEYNSISFCFYHSLLSLYDSKIYTTYENICFTSLNQSQKVTYLLNKAYLDFFKTYNLNYQTVKAFINNISHLSEKECVSLFVNMFDGFVNEKSYILDQLSELKKYYLGETISLSGGTLGPFYKIKNIVMEIYNFIFYNNIFIERVGKEIKDIFSLYVDAIFCSNGEYSSSESQWLGVKSSKEKYKISILDVDIITKYVSTKKLVQIFNNYHVEKLSINFEEEHLVNIFKNLVKSILTLNIHSNSSIWKAIINILLLINHIDLDESNKKLLEENIVLLLSDKKFDDFFFSIHYPDFNVCSKVFANLCENVISKSNYYIINVILKSKDFFDYETNTNYYYLRTLLKSFIKEKDNNVEKNIKLIIDSFENINQKLTIIGLLFQVIPKGEINDEIKRYIDNNFVEVRDKYLLDFVLNDFIIFSEEKINNVIDEIIDLDIKNNKTSVRMYPNYLERKLELIYLFIITDKISDMTLLRRLEKLNTKTHFIDFILHPETFDFNCVDFSNYMWVNFARNPKFMKYFLNAKEILIPKIQHRIKVEEASEDEKKILYGFMLDKEKIWK